MTGQWDLAQPGLKATLQALGADVLYPTVHPQGDQGISAFGSSLWQDFIVTAQFLAFCQSCRTSSHQSLFVSLLMQPSKCNIKCKVCSAVLSIFMSVCVRVIMRVIRFPCQGRKRGYTGSHPYLPRDHLLNYPNKTQTLIYGGAECCSGELRGGGKWYVALFCSTPTT